MGSGKGKSGIRKIDVDVSSFTAVDIGGPMGLEILCREGISATSRYYWVKFVLLLMCRTGCQNT